MVDEIAVRPPASPVLLAGRNVDPVHFALEAAGVQVVRWRRWAEPPSSAIAEAGSGPGGETLPEPWPPDGPFASALLRLPRAKDELEMEAHALFARLSPGASLYLFGARDEGVVSAPRRLEPLLGSGGSVSTLAVKARSRVVELRRGGQAPPLQGALEEWTRTSTMVLDGRPRPWVSFPGLFAGGSLDPGTALLLDALPTIRSGSRVLDFGCGTGVIARTVMDRAAEDYPDGQLDVDLLDADALALEAARRNVSGAAEFLTGWGLAAARGPYDWILTNPPFHEGKAETMRVLEDVAADAPGHLTRRGGLVLVTQRRLPVGRLLEERFRRVDVLSETSVFRVWSASACHPVRRKGSSSP